MGAAVYWHAGEGDQVRGRWSSADGDLAVVKVIGVRAEDLAIFMTIGQLRALRDVADGLVREADRAASALADDVMRSGSGEVYPACNDFAGACGAAAGEVCEPGCPSLAADPA